ncbi:MAG: preprotein translocase subunit SecG [Gammaproteobacteria bacterium]
MDGLHTGLLVFQVLVALALIVIILIQHGKGADAGAAFGGGSSGTVFGSQGSGNFLTKTTTALAVMFLANSLALGYIATRTVEFTSLMEQTTLEAEEAAAPASESGRDEQELPLIPQ